MNDLLNEIRMYLNDYPPALSLFNKLMLVGNVYAMGGLLREYKDNNKILSLRDADFAVNIKNQGLWEELLNTIPNKENRFGGYKFFCSGLIIDVWDVKETWAIKNNFIKVSNDDYLSVLPDTVFLNMDSICFDLKNGIWNDKKYNEAIETNTLDIILKNNPFTELNILRAMIIKKKYNMIYSENLKELMNELKKQNSDFVQSLQELQMLRYGYEIISNSEISSELSNIS